MNNLIGITGQKGSGKDTVATIITLLSINRPPEYIVQFIETNNKYLPVDCNYEIKKFAQPIKDFVANILGVSVEKLEDREFKEKELGEEWVYYQNWVDKNVIISEKQFNLLPTEKTAMWRKRIHTPRTLMQLIGTEVCRQIHPNFWINSLFKDYTPTGDTLLEGEIRKVREEDLIYPKWIISDCRFNNEAEAIKSKGGVIIKVERDLDNQDSHKSEKGINDNYVDLVINNNSSIQDLITEVKNKMNG